MYEMVTYGRMIADKGRVASYSRALEAHIAPGSVILDIGTGPGIFALIACRHGAAKVYAVEPYDVIQLAREAAAASGLAERVVCLQATSTDIVLPEKVDGIVSDLRGVLPLFQKSLVSIIDARDRFLKPDGWIVAARDTMWAAVVSSPSLHDEVTKSWETAYGFDFSSARTRGVNQWLGTSLKAEDLLVEPQCWAVVEYRTIQRPDVSGEASWAVDGDFIAHGVSVWFDCETAPGLGFSNSPASGERHLYKQAFFPWPEATWLTRGDRVSVRLHANFVQSDYVWSWDTRVMDGGSGEMKATYHQSSFFGTPPSRDRLSRRGHAFVADPNEDSRIDRRIIALMDEKLTLGEIGSRILAEYPSHFKDWYAALTRVGDLSERYTR
jgi:PRMT5 arginine-N-methyltransferase/ribosomal protein L11 methyltransferase PrmA